MSLCTEVLPRMITMPKSTGELADVSYHYLFTESLLHGPI